MRCSLDNEPVFCSFFLKAGSWGKGKRMKEKVKRTRIFKEIEEPREHSFLFHLFDLVMKSPPLSLPEEGKKGMYEPLYSNPRVTCINLCVDITKEMANAQSFGRFKFIKPHICKY